MPEIGPTLREARMRARIDITEVEQATKIRAKYLRAIENEEWALLPGAIFVKSFLREYANYLGLDARLLVEEYKLRYERPSEHELAPISPNLRGRERRGGSGGGGRGAPPRWVPLAAGAVALLALLWLIGSLGGGDDEPKGRTATTRTRSAPAAAQRTTPARRPAAAPTTVTVRLTATGPLFVCLVDRSGRELIDGATLAAGQEVRPVRAKALRLTLGNDQVRLRVNGKLVRVRPSSKPIAYELTPRRVRLLPSASGPTCA